MVLAAGPAIQCPAVRVVHLLHMPYRIKCVQKQTSVQDGSTTKKSGSTDSVASQAKNANKSAASPSNSNRV